MDWWVPSRGLRSSPESPAQCPAGPGRGWAGGSSVGAACAWCCEGGGVGRCLSPDKGERVGHDEPAGSAPPGGETEGECREGKGRAFHSLGPSAAAGAEGRGLASLRG